MRVRDRSSWRWWSSVLVSAAMTAAACSAGAGGAPGGGGAASNAGGSTAAGGAAGGGSGTNKFHVVVQGGPYPGTYDATTQDGCLAGASGAGSWSATYEPSGDVAEGKLGAIGVTYIPNPVVAGSPPYGILVSFGPIDNSVVYQGGGATGHVDDRQTSVTITAATDKVQLLTQNDLKDINAKIEATVECGQVERAPTP